MTSILKTLKIRNHQQEMNRKQKLTAPI